jgi:hypothetical protein
MMGTYPNTLIPVEIHTGDAYTTTWGQTRWTYYSITGWPCAWFDCWDKRSGAYTNDASQVNYYTTAYTECRNVATDVTMAMGGQKLNDTTYRVSIKVGIDPGGVAKTMRLQCVQVLDHWPATPNYSRNTFKQAAAVQAVSPAPGTPVTVTKDFTLDAASLAQLSDVKFIAWVQQPGAPPSASSSYQAHQLVYPFPSLSKKGDLNCDGEVDGFDIDPFFAALADPTAWQAQYPGCDILNGDINNDGAMDGFDIDPFFVLLGG